MLKLKSESIEFGICPHCGSTEYIENYPSLGKRVCTQCGHESEKITLKFIEKDEELFDTCYFCGTEGDEDDPFFEDDDILIFKCKKCGKLNGYNFPELMYGFEHTHDSLSIKIAKNEGAFIHPASKYREFEKELRKREKDLVEKCKKQLDYLIYSVLPELSAAGIDPEVINRAKRKVQFFIKWVGGPQTNKKLRSLFPAVLLNIPGNKFTERQLEKIFGVTRKTIRNWKEILQKETQKERPPLKLGVRALNTEGQLRRIVVEIPKELESIIRLEKPFKDKCHFCEQIELLSWRIQYVNGSWSNVCEKSYEHLTFFALYYDWKIEEYLH